MWEAIAANHRRSRLLIILMGMLLILTGAAVGLYVDPQAGPVLGVVAGGCIWLVLTITAMLAGDSILLSSIGAQRIEKADAPQLWNVVEEMTIAAGLPTMPEVYIIEEDGLNAFAVGRRPEKAAVAVTSGLLKRLNRDELQGVIAHEIGHIRNLDIRFMTMAAVMVGSINILSEIFFRSLRHGTGSRRSSRGNNNGAAILMLIALVVAILAPIAAQILYFACSRTREYLADASAARFTRYPAGLANALEKISHRSQVVNLSKATAPLFIINPLQAMGTEGLFSTHPPTGKRIAILRAMGNSAGYAAYEAAYHAEAGDKRRLLGERTLAAETDVPAREPIAEMPAAEPVEDKVARVQQVTDLLARLGDYLILPCVCGLKIKLPPEFRGDTVQCPRCAVEHRIPQAQLMAAIAALPGAARHDYLQSGTAGKPSEKALVYQRQGTGWESFKCTCGQNQQISPYFSAQRLSCRRCGRTIEIT